MKDLLTLRDDALLITVPTPEFTDVWVDGWDIGPTHTTAGRLSVMPWSQERIDEYRLRMRKHNRYGRHLRNFHDWLLPADDDWDDESESPGWVMRLRTRLAGALNRRFVVYRPNNQTRAIMNCMLRPR